ncbi:MAG: DNA replication and repair protein RecF [Rikenellaceae bacterium]|nr:DNA replication and repair protein RecF [Rikenellaceae bacterium]MCL2692565.1 DNA replication and repair protein RecF [Rikenellaceae bacterium]
MFLKKLSALNFKNLVQAELAFDKRINCLVGGNGAGKTNVMDAVYYLSMCRSALAMTDGQSVRHGTDFFVLDGEYISDGGRAEHVVCSFRRGDGKALKRNGKEYERLSEHIGLVPVVIVSPADTALVNEAAEERRRWLNAFLSQLDKTYLAAIVRYNHILGERNRLLKSAFSQDILAILDMQLAEAGETIHRCRAQIAERLSPHVAEFYRALSDDAEQVELHYHSELNDTPFADILAASHERDRVMQFTTCGIHRDDLRMRIGGHALRKYGSQGQQKSFLIALKLAQWAIIAEHTGERPLLLLDDLFDKLDGRRVERLLALVSRGDFGQIFITDCNRERLTATLSAAGEDYTLFDVRDGEVTCACATQPAG